MMIEFVCASAIALSISLSPNPQFVSTDARERFVVEPGTTIVISDDAEVRERELIEDFAASFPDPLPIINASEYRPEEPAIVVGNPASNIAFQNRNVLKALASMDEPGPQGYLLAVTRKVIALSARDSAGLANGLRTLHQLLGEDNQAPLGKVRDHPDLEMRGVIADAPLREDRLRELADLKCNTIFFANADFRALDEHNSERWQSCFAMARRLGIEPIPVVDLLNPGEALLGVHHEAAEGRIQIDTFSLSASTPVALSKTNVIDTAGSPISVAVSGVPCRLNTDYVIEQGQTSFPFFRTNSAWRIRRMEGGAIPDGASVTIEYTYVPPGTATLCPHAPASKRWIAQTLDALVKTLAPDYIHIGLGEIARINADSRCRALGETNAQCFSEAISFIAAQVGARSPNIRLVMWADALNPYQDGPKYGLRESVWVLPKDLILGLRMQSANLQTMSASVEWAAGRDNDFVIFNADSQHLAHAACRLAGEAIPPAMGVFAPASSPTVASLVLEKSWSLATPAKPWPQGLNEFFGTAYWEPDYDDVLSAMVSHLNRQTVAGVAPDDAYKDFQQVLGEVKRNLPKAALDARLLNRLYRNLTEYLELEAAYAKRPRNFVLLNLEALVRNQAEIAPGWEAERTEIIVSTIQSTEGFVPSSILFGEYLAPYRERIPPAGTMLLEAPAVIQTMNEQHETDLRLDFGAPPGPLYRFDFETVGAVSLLLEAMGIDGRYRTVAHHASSPEHGILSPLFISPSVLTEALKIHLETPPYRAVLKNPRVYAFKEPATTMALPAASSITLDGSLSDSEWDAPPDAYGFVAADSRDFASVPSTVRIRYTRDALVVGFKAHEPRLETMIAGSEERDGPLWTEESFEIRIHPETGNLFRFIVNPRGAKFDSRNWDSGWDGEWQAQTRQQRDAWSAEIAIPFETLGAKPSRDSLWEVNFLRTRRNIRSEDSSWAVPAAVVSSEMPTGKLRFAKALEHFN